MRIIEDQGTKHREILFSFPNSFPNSLFSIRKKKKKEFFQYSIGIVKEIRFSFFELFFNSSLFSIQNEFFRYFRKFEEK